jgi:hypothetical protein
MHSTVRALSGELKHFFIAAQAAMTRKKILFVRIRLRHREGRASACANASSRRSISRSSCKAVSVMRRRAWPAGTVGGRIAGA